MKYAGATAGVVGASALGADYLLRPSSPSLNQTQATTSSIPKPPAISNFQWKPTRVINGKVYDATISLDIQSDNPLMELNAVLDGYAPTIPARAYPAEESRTLQLLTSPQSAGATAYSANVTDLKGGKQYKHSAQAVNSVGQSTSVEYETPYVREFENIAGKDSLILGAVYNPWFENPCVPGHFCHWGELQADFQKGTTPLGTPLLGLYNSSDPMVIAKHIDWATGYGIDFFLFDFWDRDSASWRYPPLLQHPLIGDIKFALSYATPTLTGDNLGQLRNISLSSPDIYSRVESDFDYIAANCFSHPSYLRVNGRPFFSMYDVFFLGGDILEPLTRLRQHLKQLGFDIYLVGDAVDVGETIDLNRLRAFDAISNASSVVPLPVGPSSKMKRMSMGDARYELQRWTSAAHSVGIEFVPFAYPGFDDSHLVDRPSGYGHTPKSPEFFSSEVKMAIDLADKNRLLGIAEFDGWGENTFIEPSVEDGFKYLQTLRNALAGQ